MSLIMKKFQIIDLNFFAKQKQYFLKKRFNKNNFLIYR